LEPDYEKSARMQEMKQVDWRRIKRVKDSDVLETVEEVFDRKTVMALYQMINKGVIDSMRGVVKAGKESRVYWAKGRAGEDLAVKIFLTSSMEFKKSMIQYIQGDPRFRIGHDYRKIVYTWAQKEFRNLTEARAAGVKVPRPIYTHENIIVMEFLGREGVSSPILKEVPREWLTLDLYNDLMGSVSALYRGCGLIHADLSEYNVMLHGWRPYLIDFGQAVPKEHPMAEEFLRRDIENIVKFFKKAGLDVPGVEDVLKWLKRT
jgi:RIO kinase 1